MNVQTTKAVISTVVMSMLILLITPAYGQNLIPDTEVKTLNGQTVMLQDYIEDDQITVISFWATWCKPCKKELDAIADLYAEWQETYNMKLIAISVDNARAVAKVKPMVAEKQWPFEILVDMNQTLMRSLHFQSVPYTLLLNKKGEVVYTHSGYLPGDEETLESEMVALSQ